MINRRRLLVVLAAVAISLTPASAASAAGSYRYPVQPGTQAWAALATHKDMERVTQLPGKLVKTMSTDRLATAVLDYPLLLDAMAFNNVQRGFETVASRFNGLQELLRRPDAGEVLLRRYGQFNAAVSASDSELVTGDRTLAAWKLEILLAQPQVLKTLAGAGLEQVLQTARAQFAAKQAHSAAYGQAGLDHTAVLLGRALATREGWSYDQSRLLREAFAPVADAGAVATAVDRHFAAPADSHRIDDGFSTQDYNTTVYTPRGTAVTVTATTYELSSSTITSYNNYVATNYPSATRKSNASRRYNCHSFAWYWASTSNTYWMNTPGDDKYWQDGSYTYWHPPYIYFSNMKWSWVYGDHSGNESGTSGYINSKWGQLPWMYHHWAYSPYNDSDTNQYFRT